MDYSQRPPAVKGPQNGEKGKKAYENLLSRDLGAPKIYQPKAPKGPQNILAQGPEDPSNGPVASVG